MAMHTVDDLHAWQLANELRARVFLLVRETTGDYRFRSRIRRAAASAPRSIADGILCPTGDFDECLRAANRALMDASIQLREGCERGYFTASDVEPLLFLAGRASAAATSLARYIDACAVTRFAAE